MKKSMLAMVVAMTVAGSSSVLAAEKTDLDGLKTENGKVVAAYYQMHFRECNREGAIAKYYAKNAVEHGWLGMMGNNAAAGMGGAGGPPAGAAPQGAAGGPPAGAPPQGDMAAGGKCEPDADMLKIIVQGDLVFVQAHGHTTKPNGDLLWILYRVKDGKIVEHWDTHDVIPDSQVGKQW